MENLEVFIHLSPPVRMKLERIQKKNNKIILYTNWRYFVRNFIDITCSVDYLFNI